jgi:hypothetical protein
VIDLGSFSFCATHRRSPAYEHALTLADKAQGERPDRPRPSLRCCEAGQEKRERLGRGDRLGLRAWLLSALAPSLLGDGAAFFPGSVLVIDFG